MTQLSRETTTRRRIRHAEDRIVLAQVYQINASLRLAWADKVLAEGVRASVRREKETTRP